MIRDLLLGLIAVERLYGQEEAKRIAGPVGAIFIAFGIMAVLFVFLTIAGFVIQSIDHPG